MGRGKRVIDPRKQHKKFYNFFVKLNRDSDREIIKAIQKIPLGRRTSIIRSILYMHLVVGDKTPREESNLPDEPKSVKHDAEAEIGLFIKSIKGGK